MVFLVIRVGHCIRHIKMNIKWKIFFFFFAELLPLILRIIFRGNFLMRGQGSFLNLLGNRWDPGDTQT